MNVRCLDFVVRKKKSHLEATFAQELVSSSERNLNDASEFSEFLAGVVLNVGDALDTKSERDVSRTKKKA